MIDVLIAGAGPAGSIAALLLARAGARVVLVDRDAFPRDKLCGDTLNPGAVRLLGSLGLAGDVLRTARPLAGMLLTGPFAAVRTLYGDDAVGLAVPRRDFDEWLLKAAIRAGAHFESGLAARAPLIDDSRAVHAVRGLALIRRRTGVELRLPAAITIAADGRRSVVARALGLSVHPPRPRRWAFGVYATGVAELGDVGEMHIRAGHYVGIAPITETVANICVVTGPRPDGNSPAEVVRRALAADRAVAARCRDVTFVSRVRVLGPLATDVRTPGAAGLLLAGDAAGFVDPMTGDGLHLAMQSAVLAAEEAARALDTGDVTGAPGRLAAARRAAFGGKLRFNRGVRRLVEMPLAIDLAACGAWLAPGIIRRAVRYAGDLR